MFSFLIKNFCPSISVWTGNIFPINLYILESFGSNSSSSLLKSIFIAVKIKKAPNT